MVGGGATPVVPTELALVVPPKVPELAKVAGGVKAAGAPVAKVKGVLPGAPVPSSIIEGGGGGGLAAPDTYPVGVEGVVVAGAGGVVPPAGGRPAGGGGGDVIAAALAAEAAVAAAEEPPRVKVLGARGKVAAAVVGAVGGLTILYARSVMFILRLKISGQYTYNLSKCSQNSLS